MIDPSDWYCAGCGIKTPNCIRCCDCATNVVCKKGEGSRWKSDAPAPDSSSPVSEEMERELLAAGQRVWDTWHEPIDAKNVGAVRLAALRAILALIEGRR